MASLCFDTNIFIDALQGNLDAIALLDSCGDPVISKIVHMEVMAGCKHHPAVIAAELAEYDTALAAVEEVTLSWLKSTFGVLPMDDITADFSVRVRNQTNAKLPDTVIHATAILNGLDLITRNPRDFKALAKVPAGYQNIAVLVPYHLPPKQVAG